jgi:hypothetical protein
MRRACILVTVVLLAVGLGCGSGTNPAATSGTVGGVGLPGTSTGTGGSVGGASTAATVGRTGPTGLGGSAAPEEIRAPNGILKRIDALIKDDVEKWCAGKGIAWPTAAVVLRIFKREHEIEIWAKNEGQGKMVLVRTIPICAMDFDPGPKIADGDGKTPEGIYHPDFSYQSANWWMWMDLDREKVGERGQVGKGSCFKMCIEYPNDLDRRRTKEMKHTRPGGEICLHGNCVSAGCASFKNADFLPVFAFARHHDTKKFGKLQLHIFPFRFEKLSDADKSALAEKYPYNDAWGKQKLLQFWANLKEGYDKFNSNPNPLSVSIGQQKYEFK